MYGIPHCSVNTPTPECPTFGQCKLKACTAFRRRSVNVKTLPWEEVNSKPSPLIENHENQSQTIQVFCFNKLALIGFIEYSLMGIFYGYIIKCLKESLKLAFVFIDWDILWFYYKKFKRMVEIVNLKFWKLLGV